MRKTVSTLVGLVLAAVALTPTAANASSIESIAGVPPRDGALEEISEIVGAGVDRVVLLTGNYEYNCVGADGSSYFLALGAPLTDCKGQFLQKYLDGSMLDSIDLAYGVGAVSTAPSASDGCIVSVASEVSLVFFPPTGALAWITVGGLSTAGILASCVSY
jgi:hypothetical protein